MLCHIISGLQIFKDLKLITCCDKVLVKSNSSLAMINDGSGGSPLGKYKRQKDEGGKIEYHQVETITGGPVEKRDAHVLYKDIYEELWKVGFK